MVAGQPVAVHAPARKRPGARVRAAGPQPADTGGGRERRCPLPGDEEVPYLGAAGGRQQPFQLGQVARAQLGDRRVDLVVGGRLGQRQILAVLQPRGIGAVEDPLDRAAERGEEGAAQHLPVVDHMDVEDRRGADVEQPVGVVERAVGQQGVGLALRYGEHDGVRLEPLTVHVDVPAAVLSRGRRR